MKKRVRIKKQTFGIFLVCFMLLTGIFTQINVPKAEAAQQPEEMRALWVSVFDFEKLGLNTSKESTFRTKAQTLLTDAKENGINTIFFHVRAFDDAVFPSENFKLSKYVKSGSAYDPLAIMVELAHQNDMELHGWMNPYRITYDYFLDPAKSTSTKRIQLAVEEVMERGVDGIHFDDYFYHAKTGYKDTSGKVTIKVSGEPSASKKRAYVNKMLLAVHETVDAADPTAVFGISPQGNLSNCRNSGADIDTWLSEPGYTDYVMPQLYWSNQYKSSSEPKMFNSRMQAYKDLNEIDLPLYAGLALYKANKSDASDLGWKKKSNNIQEQVETLRSNGYMGYSLFSAQDLYRAEAKKELENYRKTLDVDNAIPLKRPQFSSEPVNYNTIKLNWNRIDGASGYKIYRSISKTGTYKLYKTIYGSNVTSYSDTGLSTGKTYYYKLRAYRSLAGKTTYSDYSPRAYRTPIPQKPLISSSLDGDSIKIKWTNVTGADGFSVYRSNTEEGPFTFQKRFNGTGTRNYTQSGLESGQTYYYKVKAYHTENGKRVYGYNSTIVHRTVK